MENHSPAGSNINIEKEITNFDRSSLTHKLEQAATQRAEILRRFPIKDWPSLPLERYALGQEDSEDTYCRWLEFKSQDLGSMRGGSAAKLVIYKHRDKPGWFFYPPATDEQEAWQMLRGGFVRMFEAANSKEWQDIDDLQYLSYGPALRCKTLHVYFPDDILPVYSTAHIRHFLGLLVRPEAQDRSLEVVRLNRALLEALRDVPLLKDWSTLELGFWLYDWADPRGTSRVVKIAPGHNAKFWSECLAGGFICVGWPEMGDLRQYETENDFRADFDQKLRGTYKNSQSTLRSKARELWTFRQLEPGDMVVANQGMSRILGVGTVTEPGYVYDDSRSEYRHTVKVKWDTTYAKEIPAQKRWAFQTVADIPPALQRLVLSRDGDGGPEPIPFPPRFSELAEALLRKGQVVLYGPPGTGKTYLARQFTSWWLMREAGSSDASAVMTSVEGLNSAERSLGSRLTRLTFHPSYTYEDFVEGFRPTATQEGGLQLKLEDGVFKRICSEAATRPSEKFIVLIDEINRANIAKVFGELITLLEIDKRGVTVLLPQSKEVFAIPPNVLIVATMNTADRSIKLLDVALRRRFAFIELMPEPDLLSGTAIGGLSLDVFLERLNRRIMAKEGREKQIGHAFLLHNGEPITESLEFARRFRQEILPLLQEYCYEDYASLSALLGPKLVDAEAQMLNEAVLDDPDSLMQCLLESFGADESIDDASA
jgi:5-methylcytosine-specific restriction enzyme B